MDQSDLKPTPSNSFNQQNNNKYRISNSNLLLSIKRNTFVNIFPLCPSDDPACFLTACVSQVHPGACGRGQQQQCLKSRRQCAAGSARAQAVHWWMQAG